MTNNEYENLEACGLILGLADLHLHLGVMSAPSLSTNLSGQSLSFPPRVRD